MLSSRLICLLTVLSAAVTGFATPPVVPGLGEDLDPAIAGQVLLSELNCVACHGSDFVPSRGAPDLTEVRSRVHATYLEQFIAAPHEVKPGTVMPHLLGKLSPEERQSTSEAIVDYLLSLGTSDWESSPVDPECVERGRGLFHRVGCVACHSPEGTPLPGSSPLHGIDEKYSLASLTAFLENPLEVRPGGRMPDLSLDHWEALDIASYLLEKASPKPIASRDAPLRIEEGKQLFQKHGCVQCHQPSEVIAPAARHLSELDVSTSCTTADYALSDSQTAQVSAALRSLDTAIDPATEIRLHLTRMNCVACHQRDDYGGHSAERDRWFTSSNLNLGEQARIPPSLTGVGAKLDRAWLRKVLVGGKSVRPYLDTRMPKFGEANVAPLVDLFAKFDHFAEIPVTRIGDEKKAREAGLELVGARNLNCVACHTFKGESATTLEGLELTSLTERLQENWFHLYLRNPQQFHPTTIMPSFWPGGKPVRPEILDGDTGKQIDAIWQYLSRGREARTPFGIRREPIEFGPSEGEAVMLRRQYKGIGKRGIGVGYPAGINLSFDATQMRLGAIWKGDFAEMSGVWRGQGSGNVGERSREVVRFPPGPGLALLAQDDEAWPLLEEAQKAPALQLLGYRLDKEQRPTFRYQWDGLEISDAFIDQADGPSLVRTLTFSKPAPEKLFIRLAADGNLQATDQPNHYRLPHHLTITTPESGFLRKTGDVPELLVPLGGKMSLTIDYRFQAP